MVLSTNTAEFRNDINGLRAIAVIAVVLFHFNSSWLPGGFAGVDIFFVISGFLMTKIIFQGFEKNSFSLFEFYINRATRIFPALAALCAFILMFSWFYLSASEYRSLGKHVASTLGFVSNIIYWMESGYFTPASKERWLLHTWSLSVEWQFYIIFPILLVLLKRILTLDYLKIFLIVVTISGYLFSGIFSNSNPEASFYLLPTRIWEFTLGGLAFLFPLQLANKNKQALELIGLLLIIVFYIFSFGSINWPGFYSIVPVMGAFLMIQSARNDSAITGNIVFQNIGLWSYSIYIWHWPLVVYIYDIGYTIERAFIGILLSIILGCISYHLIEKNRRSGKPDKNIKAFLLFNPHIYMFILALFGTSVYLSNGVNIHFRKAAISLEAAYIDKYKRENFFTEFIRKEYKEECNFYDDKTGAVKAEGISKGCLDSRGKGGVFLWGDSHSQALSFGLRSALPNSIPFHQISSSGCRPLIVEARFSSGESKKACDLSNSKALESIQYLNPGIIIMAQAKEHDLTNFNEIVAFLREKGVTSQFFLIGPVPQWKPSLPKAIAKRHLENSKIYISDTTLVTDFLEMDKELKEKYQGTEVHYISLIESLCKGESCLAKVDNNNTPLHWDYGHLTLEGSEYVAKHIIYKELESYFLLENKE